MFSFLGRRKNRRGRGGVTDYELQPASEFLFERRLLDQRRRPETNASGFRAVLVSGNQAAHSVVRREDRVIGRHEAPSLTVTSDPGNSIVIAGGSGPDWSMFFCAAAGGETESEAAQQLRHRSISISGSTVSLTGPSLYEGHNTSSELVVDGPRDAGVVVHTSYAAAEVRDMAGPVRVAATHARASVLYTTGQVDATAGVVDFAGSSGRVTLSAEMEIDLKITAREFDGTLLAWAQRSVRILVPPGFSTPFEVTVGTRDHFVCRTDLVSKVRHRRQGDLHVFTYGTNAGERPGGGVHLRSEQSTVVIDHFGGKP